MDAQIGYRRGFAEIGVFVGIWRNYVVWLEGRREPPESDGSHWRYRRKWLGSYTQGMHAIELHNRRLVEEGYAVRRK